MERPDFIGFPKIFRLSREIIVTEKLDGTNAQVLITEDGDIFAGSRTRWITPQEDNYGFAKWVEATKFELLKLGPGQYFGEWWGKGIQRGYDLQEKKFSLFNTLRWIPMLEAGNFPSHESGIKIVPVLYQGIFDQYIIDYWVERLRVMGSVAAPGYMKPEGVVVFHTASGVSFKKTLEKDGQPKGITNA